MPKMYSFYVLQSFSITVKDAKKKKKKELWVKSQLLGNP